MMDSLTGITPISAPTSATITNATKLATEPTTTDSRISLPFLFVVFVASNFISAFLTSQTILVILNGCGYTCTDQNLHSIIPKSLQHSGQRGKQRLTLDTGWINTKKRRIQEAEDNEEGDNTKFCDCSSCSSVNEMQGALVTSDCLFRDYSYAIDIFLSCGSERFNDDLRLHTFKRHAFSHAKVFTDQLLTYRDRQLWFDAYNQARCIQIASNGDLRLSTNVNTCAEINFVMPLQSLLALNEANNNDDSQTLYLLRETATGRCLALGSNANCDSDRSTGGSECGGIDHRFLPLAMVDDCEDNALLFRFQQDADFCSGEFPSNACFDD